MASRGHGWFDDAKLLPSERLVRSGWVRLRIPGPPYWWEGALTLTTDRLFFLPRVDHPRLDSAAFWLCEVGNVTSPARNRFTVEAAGETATFHLIGRGPAGLVGDGSMAWVQAVLASRRTARPREAFADPPARRAAG